jgi:hypothetical protein
LVLFGPVVRQAVLLFEPLCLSWRGIRDGPGLLRQLRRAASGDVAGEDRGCGDRRYGCGVKPACGDCVEVLGRRRPGGAPPPRVRWSSTAQPVRLVNLRLCSIRGMLPRSMRALLSLVLCSLVVVAPGWTRGAAVAPPRCSDAGSRGVETGWLLPGHQVVSVAAPAPATRNAQPTYTRMCGPASAVVRLHGMSFWIPGGRCALNGERDYVLQVGMTAAPPAAPGKSLDLFVGDPRAATQGGAFRIGGDGGTATSRVTAEIQLPHYGSLDASGGTITIEPSRRLGTFAFRLRDATRVTGRWTCG